MQWNVSVGAQRQNAETFPPDVRRKVVPEAAFRGCILISAPAAGDEQQHFNKGNKNELIILANQRLWRKTHTILHI